MSSAPLLWFSSRYIWVPDIQYWRLELQGGKKSCTVSHQEISGRTLYLHSCGLFIYDFAGFKPNNTSIRVCFSLTPKLPCRDQCSWQFPQGLGWSSPELKELKEFLSLPHWWGQVWIPQNKADVSKLEKVQLKATKVAGEKLRKMSSFSLEKGGLRARTISSQKHKTKGPKQWFSVSA